MKIVRVGPNPAYKLPAKPDAKATAEAIAAWRALEANWAAVKESRVLNLPYVTAMDNVRNSGGMYAILPEAEAPGAVAAGIKMPEDMSADELKLTALQLGINMQKPMKKAALIAAVRSAMDAVQIIDDEEDEAE